MGAREVDVNFERRTADAQDIAGVLIRSRVPFDCLGCHFGLRKRYEPLARTLIAEALAASRYTFS